MIVEVLLYWLVGILFVGSAIAFVTGVRMLIDWYEEKTYKPRMRKQRDTF